MPVMYLSKFSTCLAQKSIKGYIFLKPYTICVEWYYQKKNVCVGNENDQMTNISTHHQDHVIFITKFNRLLFRLIYISL